MKVYGGIREILHADSEKKLTSFYELTDLKEIVNGMTEVEADGPL